MPYPNSSKTKKEFPWIGQVRVQGVKRRKQFSNKKMAIRWEAEEKERLEEGLSKSPVEVETIHSTSLLQWATLYLEYAEKQFVLKTFGEKKMAFNLLLTNPAIDPHSPVETLPPLTALNHLQNQEIERTGNAANKQRKNLGAAWKWGTRFLNMPTVNPFATVFKFAEERHDRYVPTLEDFWRTYDMAEEGQDKLMLLMYLHTGARRDELFRLQWKDVDFDEKKVRLYWRKNKAGEWKSAWLPTTEEVVGMLKAHQRITGLQMFVFLNFQGSKDQKNWLPYVCRQKFLSELCVKAGVPEFGLHGVRHLFASILAEKRSLIEIQMMMRHQHLTTTQRYIHSLNKEGREVLSALPGPDSRSKSPLKAPQLKVAL